MVRSSYLVTSVVAITLAACWMEDGPPDGTSGASDEVADALAGLPQASVEQMGADGIPTVVRGDLGRADGAVVDLAAIAPVFRLSPEELVLVSARADALGHRRLRYRQETAGLEVVGGTLDLHVDDAGVIFLAVASARGIDVSSDPSIDRTTAGALVASAEPYRDMAVAGGRLVYLLAIGDGQPHLAWEVTASGTRDGDPVRDLVYLDAHAGAIVEIHPTIAMARNRATYNLHNGTNLPGILERSEGQGPVYDVDVNSAHDLAGDFYDCYQALFARDSFDDAGATLRSSVHYSTNYANAFWNGSQVVYGDGDGSTLGRFDRDPDVVTHELTHAITERESGLLVINEPGALNESNSDTFAAICSAWKAGAVSADTWRFAEIMWTPLDPGDAYRYLDDPALDGVSRDYYPDRYTGTSDSGGVHWNCGIPNLAFELATVGGQHPRGKTTIPVVGAGIDRTAQVWYRAATVYYNSTASMAWARRSGVQSSIDLYPDQPAVKRAVGDAWRAVGVPLVQMLLLVILQPDQPSIEQPGAYDRLFAVDVPGGVTNVLFHVHTSGGDVDLFGRYGSAPTGAPDAEAMGEGPGGDEWVSIETRGRTGLYYLLVKNYLDYSDIEVTASYSVPGIPLTDAVPRPGIGGEYHARARFNMQVPSGMNRVSFTTTGGTGDVSLYASSGVLPDIGTGQFQKRSTHAGNQETITVKGAAAVGSWNLLVYGKAAFSGVPVTGHFWTERTWANLAGDTGSKLRKNFVVPTGSKNLTITIRGAADTTGEADLYVRLGANPTLAVWDYRPLLEGNDETVTVPDPTPGTYHLMVYGRSAYTGVTLSASTR